MFNALLGLLIKSSERFSAKTAVRYKNEEISYKMLDGLSDQLASSLISRNVREGVRVGIYIDKSIDAVIAIFGILKSGACYVPLDPMGPAARQLFIINDCSLECLVISSKKLFQIRRILQNKTSLKYIFIIDAEKEEGKENMPWVDMIFKDEISGTKNTVDQQAKQVRDNDLAYILYTSGSTGQPKGVMITHRASLAFINWAYTCFNVRSDDNISGHAPFHFDLSIFDIFVTIKAAATLCIVSQGLSAFPQSLADFIEKEKISIWYSVPSTLIQLVLYGGLKNRDLSMLRQILFAGEVFPMKYLRELMQIVPQAAYYNLYGPTETNVCTFYPIVNMPESESILPIGKPCDGTEVFVVDEAGRLIKDDNIGELYVSGPMLMEGYWNDSQKTENVLLKEFSHSQRGSNIYRTGDLVRFNKDGDLEFHGRRDNMIKSRGYRIELIEIELVLYGHPAIKEVAVLGVPNDKIGNSIQALIVLKDDYSVSEQELKLFCSRKLPRYMIPETITFKNSIPKTSTGKVDRESLI